MFFLAICGKAATRVESVSDMLLFLTLLPQFVKGYATGQSISRVTGGDSSESASNTVSLFSTNGRPALSITACAV